MTTNGAALSAPLGMLAELTHRCPLGCPYCSNPLALDKRTDELDTATWMGPFEPTNTPFSLVKEAADLLVASGLKAVALEDARP